MLKYQEVVADIKDYIDRQELQHGDRLPILSDLIAYFRVSRNTVIRALDILEAEGRIYQVRGSGIYVRSHRREGYFNLIEGHGFYDDPEDPRLHSDVLSVERVADVPEVDKHLLLKRPEELHAVRRVRLLEGEPFALEQSYYRTDIIPYLSKNIAAKSIGHYLTNELGLNLGFSDMTWELDTLESEAAELLKTQAGEPCACVTSTVYLHNGEPLSYAVIQYQKDYAKFFLQSHAH